MRFLIPARRFDESHPEMVDKPDSDPVLLEDEMRSIAAINRRFGGVTALQNALLPMVIKANGERPIEILDLATGSGDQVVALARRLHQLGKRASITAIDCNERVLRIARAQVNGLNEIKLESGDILNLKYPDRSFDFVTCSLTLHHFSWNNAVKVLQEMDRLSRRGFVLNDLSRSYVSALATWIYTRLTTTNVMTRYDGVASCFAAFSKDELRSLAAEASVGPLNIYSAPLFRLIAVKKK